MLLFWCYVTSKFYFLDSTSATANCRYNSGAFTGEGQTYFSKKIEVPDGQTLDIIMLDTVSLKVGDMFRKCLDYALHFFIFIFALVSLEWEI